MVLDSLANRLQCVGRAKRLEWTTAAQGVLGTAGGSRESALMDLITCLFKFDW